MKRINKFLLVASLTLATQSHAEGFLSPREQAKKLDRIGGTSSTNDPDLADQKRQIMGPELKLKMNQHAIVAGSSKNDPDLAHRAPLYTGKNPVREMESPLAPLR